MGNMQHNFFSTVNHDSTNETESMLIITAYFGIKARQCLTMPEDEAKANLQLLLFA